MILYVTIIVLLFLFEGATSLSQNNFFSLMQMEVIPFPEPLFVEFLWILLQLHIARRAGVRPSNKSRYSEEFAAGVCVCPRSAEDEIQALCTVGRCSQLQLCLSAF